MDLPTSLSRWLPALCLFSLGLAQESPPVQDPFSDPQTSATEDESGTNTTGIQAKGVHLQPGVVKELVDRVKPSLVAVRQIGRDGNRRGIGAGFVLDESGLIATNFHVIGEGRPVQVEFQDGSVFPVNEIFSFDRHFDLAVLRIDPIKRKLPALQLANSDDLEQGQIIVGFGSPMGLKFSVVSGVLSAIRKLDNDFLGEETPDFPMIQVAMPIEAGNSGGPVVNLKGEVIGVINLRHRVKENLGFAIRSNDLRTIWEKPNPIPIARWQTIGALDPRQWTVVMNGDWKQRGGVIFASKAGSGFGGRTLCLSKFEPPEGVFDISVQVRLDNESGAAGLVFSSDGGDRHFGFYPSGGELRLTHFRGPDVYSWKIIEQLAVAAYRPGEWNRLRVRIEGETMTGFVNGEEAVVLQDKSLGQGKVGLCKFRQTKAEFREFRIGANLESASFSPQRKEQFNGQLDKIFSGGSSDKLLGDLAANHSASLEFLEGKTRQYEAMAKKMRELKTALHNRAVSRELKEAIGGEVAKKEGAIDLFEVALQLARIDDARLDQEHYRGVFGRLTLDALEYLDGSTGETGVRKLRDFLFKENGFHGSRNEYYHHANSYINHVLDDREGLPITLSVLYIEMARRLGLEGVFGVALPGQFLVGYRKNSDDTLLLIDVFEGGKEMTRKDAEQLALRYGVETNDETFDPSPPIDIAKRMLRNLIGLEIEQKRNPAGALGYLNLLLELDSEESGARFQRALILVETRDFEGAKRDLDWLLEKRPPQLNHERLKQFRKTLP